MEIECDDDLVHVDSDVATKRSKQSSSNVLSSMVLAEIVIDQSHLVL